MKLTPLADEIASGIKAMIASGNAVPSWDALRDECDFHTGGELSAKALDMLTDMVQRRIKN